MTTPPAFAETLPAEPAPARFARLRPWLRHLPAVLGLAMFALAVFVLHRALANLTLADVTAEFHAIPRSHLVAAVALTLASHALLTLYDVVGLRYIGSALRWHDIAPTSLHRLRCRSQCRHRLALGWGDPLPGLLQRGAWRDRHHPSGRFLHDHFRARRRGAPRARAPVRAGRRARERAFAHSARSRARGAAARRARRLDWLGGAQGSAARRRRLAPSSLPLAVSQVALSVVDLLVAAAVVWLLLPGASVAFLPFVGLYIIAMALGVVSNVPGGIGVFEGMMVLLLPTLPAHALLGALLAYRVIYYLVPLILALGLLAAQLLDERRVQARALASQGALVLTRAAPQILAVVVFLAGAVLLLSGALPSVNGRLQWLGELVPDALLQLSHLLGSAIGLALLTVAHGLHRWLRRAWTVTMWLLGAGILVSLLKGFDYEETIVLALAAALLHVSRERFHRRAALADEPFTVGWLASVAIVVGGIVWLGFFAYDREAPKMLRASLFVALMFTAFALTRLLRPAVPRRRGATAEELDLAQAIVAGGSSAEANVALTGDKDFLFHPARDAFVMYRTEGRSAIALGDPVGNPARLADMVWRFRELADRLDLRCVFYQVTARAPAALHRSRPRLLQARRGGAHPARDVHARGQEERRAPPVAQSRTPRGRRVLDRAGGGGPRDPARAPRGLRRVAGEEARAREGLLDQRVRAGLPLPPRHRRGARRRARRRVRQPLAGGGSFRALDRSDATRGVRPRRASWITCSSS